MIIRLEVVAIPRLGIPRLPPEGLHSLEASDNLPDPDVIALEIVEDLEAALRS